VAVNACAFVISLTTDTYFSGNSFHIRESKGISSSTSLRSKPLSSGCSICTCEYVPSSFLCQQKYIRFRDCADTSAELRESASNPIAPLNIAIKSFFIFTFSSIKYFGFTSWSMRMNSQTKSERVAVHSDFLMRYSL